MSSAQMAAILPRERWVNDPSNADKQAKKTIFMPYVNLCTYQVILIWYKSAYFCPVEMRL